MTLALHKEGAGWRIMTSKGILVPQTVRVLPENADA